MRWLHDTAHEKCSIDYYHYIPEVAPCKQCIVTTWHNLPEATLFNDHICDILKANNYWACVEVNPTDYSLLCVSK